MISQRGFKRCLALAIGLVPWCTAFALVLHDETGRLTSKSFADPSLSPPVATIALDRLPTVAAQNAAWEAYRTQEDPGARIVLDARSGAPTLVEGHGILLAIGGEVSRQSLEIAIRRFAGRHGALLLAEDAAMSLNREATLPLSKDVWQIAFDQTVGGVHVEGARYLFYVSRRRLIAFGAARWAPVLGSTTPSISPEEARARMRQAMGLVDSDGVTYVEPERLIWLPVAAPQAEWEPGSGLVGGGYRHSLAWRARLRVEGSPGTWLVMVDARTGALLALGDEDEYARVKGGIFPISNDQRAPDGIERANYPLPFADVSINGVQQFADAMGTFTCTPPGGMATTTLAGRYFAVTDSCGPVAAPVSCDADIDLDTSPGADCNVPFGKSAGDTHAARTSFYHLNRIAQKARAWLPANTWLAETQVVDHVNLPGDCNGFWNGSVNFYKSGVGCSNLGELAATIYHEWGHGLDDNDGGGRDNPSEAYADITALLQTHDSCIPRNFRTTQCLGYGNPCLSCTGARDLDWAKRAAGAPSTPSTITSCRTAQFFAGPCGKEPHCESYLASETMMDLATRDLPASGLDAATAWQVTDQLWYLSRPGSGGDAYNCSLPASDGCGAGSWFTKLRLADDDDGDLANGTPHAAAIFAAFNRHNIACGLALDASNQNGGSCPAIAASTLSGEGAANSVSLTWTPVPAAMTYNILRTEGGCGSAFTIVATIPTTSYVDENLVDGLPEFYAVQAMGTNVSCVGGVSNCLMASPKKDAGSISLDAATYGCATPIVVTVHDGNINAPTASVTVRSNSEPGGEAITVTQVTPGSYDYSGTLQTTLQPDVPGSLTLADGDVITAEYVDADDGAGGQGVGRSAVALADCHARVTDVGACCGFTLRTFASGFESAANVGPLGVLSDRDGVLATVGPGGKILRLQGHADGKVVSSAVQLGPDYGDGNALGIAKLASVYLTQQNNDRVVQIDPATGALLSDASHPDGGVASIPNATNIAPFPVLSPSPRAGHLFVSTAGETAHGIYDVNPALPMSSAASTFSTDAADGLCVTANGATLLAAEGGVLRAYDTRNGVVTAQSPLLCSSAGGIAIGEGALAGKAFVNCTNGDVWEWKYDSTPDACPASCGPGPARRIVSGGSRGDFISVDRYVPAAAGSPYSSLLLTQTDRILRLGWSASATETTGGFFGPPESSSGLAPCDAIDNRFVDRNTMSWGAMATVDVVRGSLLELRTTQHFGSMTCLASDVDATSVVDATSPPTERGFYYLTRAICGDWGSSQRNDEITVCP